MGQPPKIRQFNPQWASTIIVPTATLNDVLSSLSQSGLRISVLLDTNRTIQGVVTDSDIRKALLAGAKLTDPIAPWVNRTPLVALEEAPAKELALLSEHYGILEIPLINGRGQMTDLFLGNQRSFPLPVFTPVQAVGGERSTPMLIPAGGYGMRLRAAVSDRPKSLAMLSDEPILQIIISRAAQAGIRNFFISVNYLAEQIEEHLKDPMYRDLNIKVIKETTRLGTAGSLGLIKDQVEGPVLVWNSDILTTVSATTVLDHHLKTGSDFTCAIRRLDLDIPYGIVEVKKNAISKVTEKPHFEFLMNAGINVIGPEVIKMIPANQPLDMPQLVQLALAAQKKVCPFLIHEYWIDIGKPIDYETAQKQFKTVFKGRKNAKPSAA